MSTAKVNNPDYIARRLDCLATLDARDALTDSSVIEAAELADQARIWCEEFRSIGAPAHEIASGAAIALSLDAIVAKTI